MPRRLKFTLETLTLYCIENNITLNKDYSDVKITRETRIDAKCLQCDNNCNKTFRNIIKNGCYCKECQNIITRQKRIKTNIENYGVPYAAQSEQVKNKIIETNMERRGVKSSLQSEEVRTKIRETNMERYGVECTLQSEQVKEKIRETNMKGLV